MASACDGVLAIDAPVELSFLPLCITTSRLMSVCTQMSCDDISYATSTSSCHSSLDYELSTQVLRMADSSRSRQVAMQQCLI